MMRPHGAGWDHGIVALEDDSLVAFSQVLPEEERGSAVAFLKVVCGDSNV